MDMTAYWLNFKKKRTGEGKYYYFYPYTRCEIDDTPTYIIGGKQYVRIEVSEAEREILREKDGEEYNDERSAHNKRWTAGIPRLQNEDGEEIDFWTDCAEDETTHYIEDDICEEMDRRAAVRCLPPLERRIYRADREGYTQSEIAKMVGVNQATVSRKLDKIYERMDAVRLYDGERTKKELAFEVGWESFLRNRFMKNDADVRVFAFFLRAQGELMALLYKWFFTPGELLRYTARYLMMGGRRQKRSYWNSFQVMGRHFCEAGICRRGRTVALFASLTGGRATRRDDLRTVRQRFPPLRGGDQGTGASPQASIQFLF